MGERSSMAVRVILSDLHFGDRKCSLRREAVSKGFRKFLRGLGLIKEVILAGDILDANIASLTQAIEGVRGSGTWPRRIGFRKWLSFTFGGRGVPVGRIVYVPGNHDYIIWNILATNRAFVEPISKGQIPKNLPLLAGEFKEPFIRGVAPGNMRDRFVVVYPDYLYTIGKKRVLVTHGHYLDEKQTLLRRLDDLVREAGGNEAKAVRKFIIGTAQYQMVANAISILRDSREFVDKVHKTLGGFIDYVSKLHNKPIDSGLLEAIEMYLLYFSRKRPDAFIFGHTHKAARTTTAAFRRGKNRRRIAKIIEVWNSGCFIEDTREKVAGTFIVTDDRAGDGDSIRLYELDLKGNIRERAD